MISNYISTPFLLWISRLNSCKRRINRISQVFTSFFVIRYLSAEWSVNNIALDSSRHGWNFLTQIPRPKIPFRSWCNFVVFHLRSYSSNRSCAACYQYAIVKQRWWQNQRRRTYDLKRFCLVRSRNDGCRNQFLLKHFPRFMTFVVKSKGHVLSEGVGEGSSDFTKILNKLLVEPNMS